MNKTENLKELLDRLYNDFDYKGYVYSDPIEFPHRYKRECDIEVVAFIASCFAYGQVKVFKSVLERIFRFMASKPYDFVRDFDIKKHGKLFQDIRYRFNTPKDITALINTLAILIRKHGSIKALFIKGYDQSKDQDYTPAVTGLVHNFFAVDTTEVYGSDQRPLGYLQFMPDPSKGSACKRINLFLRWMIRDRDVDFGLWKELPKDKLIIPLDTHIARIGRCLGLTDRNSSDLKTAIEITRALKVFDPEDPIKYDFALCHQGISRVCASTRCKDCCIKKD